MSEQILLIGGGGHCRSVIDVIEQMNEYKIIGIVDIKENIGKKVLDYEIIGSDDDLSDIFKTCKNAIITIGQIKTNKPRVDLFGKTRQIGFDLPVIISPLAYVSKHALIGIGSIIMHGAMVNAGAKVGNNCIINTKALIEHDAVVEDHCHISTGAIINGGAIVKENSFIGSNSVSKEYVTINGFIKAGGIAK